MVVGDVVTETDVLVVGGGPGGYTAALRSAALGKRVTLVERSSSLGGVCLNVGCIPSKALIHVAEVAGTAAEAAEWGLDVTVSTDMARVQKWVRGVVDRLSRGVAGQLGSAGVEVVHGEARFVAPQRAVVLDEDGARYVDFAQVIVATGSQPVELPNLPFDGERVLDSSGALALDRLPGTLAIVGGGYIGLELGSLFAKLGVQVTIVEVAAQLLPAFEPSIVRVVGRRLQQLGATVLLETQATGLDERGLAVKGPPGVTHVPAEAVVVAVGRRPSTEGLDVHVLPVEVAPSGHLPVDAAMRAGPHVLAVGDVTPGPPLAHRAMAQAEVAARSAAGLRAAFDPLCVPAVVFTDPEIVTVGMTSADAAAQGVDVESATLPFAASGRAATLGRRDGHLDLVVDRSDGTIVGVHMVGSGVAELAGEASLAVEMGATRDDLALTIHPHPTLSEALREAALAPSGRPRPA